MEPLSRENLSKAFGGALRVSPQVDILLRLCTFIESLEETSGLHVYRMTAYSLQIATEMGMGLRDREILALAAPLHDIGKLRMPGRIVLKPGRLDPHEWEIMKSHTVEGAKILEGSSFPEVEMASQVALCHHEKWDGSGYPNGFVEDSIPLPARIVAVADVYDALTTKRIYKGAYPFKTAMGMIEEGSGAHFDPEVVEAFKSCESRILGLGLLFEEIQEEIPLYRFTEFLEGRR